MDDQPLRRPLPESFAVIVADEGASVRVSPRGELDIASRHVLAARLDAAWDAGATDVVLDLSALTFMDSSGAHLLLANRERAAALGGRLAIVEGSAPIVRVMQLCGLRDTFAEASLTRAA